MIIIELNQINFCHPSVDFKRLQQHKYYWIKINKKWRTGSLIKYDEYARFDVLFCVGVDAALHIKVNLNY